MKTMCREINAGESGCFTVDSFPQSFKQDHRFVEGRDVMGCCLDFISMLPDDAQWSVAQQGAARAIVYVRCPDSRMDEQGRLRE